MAFTRFALLLALLPAAASVAAPVEGSLELLWGDADPGSEAATQFRVNLVDDAGHRYALDPDQALAAAGDLYSLVGQRVAVELNEAAALPSGLKAEAIVPASLEFSPRAAPQPLISGTTVWITILCKFNDIATEQKPVSYFAGQYGNATGQLDHYWREVSYNKINLTGSSAYGWFTLPQPRSFYVPSGGSANLGQLFTDCTNAANATVNFAVNGGAQGINMMFNGDLDGFAWGGSRCATLDGVNKCWSSTWNPPWSFNNSAPLSHEMGHGYGLPHANNSDGDSDPYDNPWDVMSSAWNNATSDATYGVLAKHLNMYSRERLGFVDAARKQTISTDGVYALELDRASLIGSTKLQVVQVMLAGQPNSHYYIIEARKRVGNYDGNLAGDAVIIHEVNTTRGEPSWSVDAQTPPANVANNEGSMFKVGETYTAPNNAFSVRVDTATTNGFTITVTRGNVANDTIFKNGFQ
ncbi:hypothetical protein [Tahibacter amnicola]|uniref:M6 family metalloprotease-like protein n=1 Tax=Tahibacter amnicola TaxID=2976241 RepID=A0ABY6BDB7_9GAMM|nr:hypothetical protein [Tahibacter amnicola]UXI67802.1 hypothetical protein N4264_24215 [Tahibacter amnicola]